ncbi:MAG: hypothetical protein IT410_00100 [Candidatus Doudnabacteria bacterium]|nr:hypothetical protein [Candidatus Doudnabacteria bacterium]
MTEKERFLGLFEWEAETTTRVLKAYPSDKLDLRPHEKSRSAKELMQTFIAEGVAMIQICEGAVDWTKVVGPDLATAEELIVAFEGMMTQVIDKIKATPGEDLEKNMDWIGRQAPRLEALMSMLFDQVHHRGQMSVYIRLADGKVPSIYGPSADEPMEQLAQ